MSSFLCERIQHLDKSRLDSLADAFHVNPKQPKQDVVDDLYDMFHGAVQRVNSVPDQKLRSIASSLNFNPAGLERAELVEGVIQIVEENLLKGDYDTFKIIYSEPESVQGISQREEALTLLKVPELKKIAHGLNVRGYLKMKKTGLVAAIERARSNPAVIAEEVQVVREAVRRDDFSDLNVKELKELAKKEGVPGYYKLTRDKLISALQKQPREIPAGQPLAEIIHEIVADDLSALNVKELKELAKKKGVPAYYKLKRDELVAALQKRPRSPVRVPAVQPTIVAPVYMLDLDSKSVKELKELARARNIKGYLKLKKTQLIDALRISSERHISPAKESPVEAIIDMAGKSVKDLKELAKEKGIRGYYKLKRDELISALTRADLEAPQHQAHVDENVQELEKQIEQRVEAIQEVIENRDVLSLSRKEVEKLEDEIQNLEEVKEVAEQVQQGADFEPAVSEPVAGERARYIDDILENIQVSKHDMYLRDVSGKILRCLGMY